MNAIPDRREGVWFAGANVVGFQEWPRSKNPYACWGSRSVHGGPVTKEEEHQMPMSAEQKIILRGTQIANERGISLSAAYIAAGAELRDEVRQYQDDSRVVDLMPSPTGSVPASDVETLRALVERLQPACTAEEVLTVLRSTFGPANLSHGAQPSDAEMELISLANAIATRENIDLGLATKKAGVARPDLVAIVRPNRRRLVEQGVHFGPRVDPD